MAQAAAGWYPVQDGSGERYWDGSGWTEHRRSFQAEPPPVAPATPARPVTQAVSTETPKKKRSIWKIIGAVVAVIIVISFLSSLGDKDDSGGAVPGNDTSTSTGEEASPPKKTKPALSVSQENAVASAKNYLGIGTGFSRYGLIKQLTSKAGSGFKRADAVFAVNYLKPDWNKQAVLSAKNYLGIGTGFSRDSLIKQLSSRAGSGFTVAEATYAANKVGL